MWVQVDFQQIIKVIRGINIGIFIKEIKLLVLTKNVIAEQLFAPIGSLVLDGSIHNVQTNSEGDWTKLYTLDLLIVVIKQLIKVSKRGVKTDLRIISSRTVRKFYYHLFMNVCTIFASNFGTYRLLSKPIKEKDFAQIKVKVTNQIADKAASWVRKVVRTRVRADDDVEVLFVLILSILKRLELRAKRFFVQAVWNFILNVTVPFWFD